MNTTTTVEASGSGALSLPWTLLSGIQIGYVTTDVDEAVKVFADTYGVSKFRISRGVSLLSTPKLTLNQSFAAESFRNLAQGGSLRIRQPDPGRQMGSEDAILGRQIFVAQQQFLIDEARYKRPEGVPSGIDRSWQNVYHRPSARSSQPSHHANILTKRDTAVQYERGDKKALDLRTSRY